MKKVEKENKYILQSGIEEIGRASSMMGLCKLINVSFPWVYYNKNKDINKNGSWSFNFKGFNYTIINITTN